MKRPPAEPANVLPEIAEVLAERDRLREDVRRLQETLAQWRGHAEKRKSQVDRLRERLAERQGRVEKLNRELHRVWGMLSKWTYIPEYARKPFYEEVRRDFFAKCLSRGALEPDHRVIEVGCGVGGVARHLLAFLSRDGGYDGLDVDVRAVEVCKREVEPLHPGFRFQTIDVKNEKYRPRGATPASQYRFPFDEATFDLAILRSVFTHMMPGDVEHYLSEVARLLRPGGRSMITFLLLVGDAEADDECEYVQSRVPHRRDGCRIADPDKPESRVAYPIEWVRDLYAKVSLRIIEPIEFATRRMPTGRQQPPTQDLVVAERA